MAVSITDLLSLPTKEQIIDKFVGLLRLAGFPTASWQTTSFMRHTVEGESELYVDLATLIQHVGKGGFIKLAGEVNDVWVDLCAENVFNEVRKPAVYTLGRATLTDAAGSGPHTINAGAFWIANPDKSLRYFNVGGGVLPLGGTLPLTFQAETAGLKWNAGNEELQQVLTPLPGVTANNPGLDTGTWITLQGADTESNAALAQRCMDKWSLVGSGSDDGAYRYHVTSVSSEITRARVYSPGGGAVRIVIAGSSGPVSSAAHASASALVESKRPLGVPDVVVLNATSNVQTLAGTLYIKIGFDPAAVLSAVQASVNSFGAALALGSKVSREKIIGSIVGITGVDDLELTSPAADVTLGANDVWVPSYALTTQTV